MIDIIASIRAERLANRRIETLTMNQIGVVKAELERDIKSLYNHGVFSKKRYERVMLRLAKKYDVIHEEWVVKVCEAYERSYKAMLIVYARKSCN